MVIMTAGPTRYNSTFPVPLNEDGTIRWPERTRKQGIGRKPNLKVVRADAAPVLELPRRRSRPDTGFSRAVKLAVRERAGNGDPDEALCEACGIWLGAHGGQVHHRAGRGSGGCRDEVIQGCANALLLCGTPFDGCHGAATRFEPHSGAAGVWIKHGTTWEFDPRNVSVLLASPGGGGIRVWLTEDGEYGYAPPRGDGAA